MPLTHAEVIRILRFCLGSDDSGSAAVKDDGSCVVSVLLTQSSTQPLTFEGATFDEALRRAALGRALKLECVEKQFRFLARQSSDAPEPDVVPLTWASRLPDAAGGAAPGEDRGSAFLDLVEAIHGLLHETQNERGLSTLFTASRGQLMADKIAAQRRRTDQQRAALADKVRSLERPHAAVLHRLDRAGALIAHLDRTRAEIDDLAATPARIIKEFSDINHELLSGLDAFLVVDGIGAQRSGALACLALLYAKEKTGVERAQLADVFFTDRFSSGQRVAAATAIAGKANYLHIFSAAAPRAAEQLLNRLLASPTTAEVERMEKVVFSDADKGFGIDASEWFTAISRKIDLLGDVSSSVIAMLREKH